jgi:hypothetical protein
VARPLIVSPWTQEQDDRLKQMAARGESVLKAAAALKRNVASVRVRARKLGVALLGAREMRRKIRHAQASQE